MTHIGGQQVATYDAAGNMTQRVEVTATTPVTYTQRWDANNRLAAVTNTDTAQATQFYYDADGERVRSVSPVDSSA